MKLNYKSIYQNIDNDIQRGVYKKFPYLERRLEHISSKCNNLAFVVNSIPLTDREIETLKENEYINN